MDKFSLNDASQRSTTFPNTPARLINVHNVNFKEWVKDEKSVYIGRANASLGLDRSSKWANPFHLSDFSNNRKVVLEKYRKYILSEPDLINSINELSNKQLGCVCSPEPCHGDLLLQLCDEKVPTNIERTAESVKPATPPSSEQQQQEMNRRHTEKPADGVSTPLRRQENRQKQEDHRRNDQKDHRRYDQEDHGRYDRNSVRQFAIVMDSNRKAINFHKLYKKPFVAPASGIDEAEDLIDRVRLTNPEGILLHVGVNDIGGGAEPAALSDRIVKMAVRAKDNFNCPVYISAITPLAYFEHEVNLCNNLTRQAAARIAHLSFLNHANINHEHLADDRHLSTRGPYDQPNGRDLLVESFAEATLHRKLTLREVKGTFRNRFQGGR